MCNNYPPLLRVCMVCGLKTTDRICPDYFCRASTEIEDSAPSYAIPATEHSIELLKDTDPEAYERYQEALQTRRDTSGYAMKVNPVDPPRLMISSRKRMGLPPGFAASIANAIKTIHDQEYPPAAIEFVSHFERREHSVSPSEHSVMSMQAIMIDEKLTERGKTLIERSFFNRVSLHDTYGD